MGGCFVYIEKWERGERIVCLEGRRGGDMSKPDGRRTQAARERARGLGVKGRRVADTTKRVKALNQKTLQGQPKDLLEVGGDNWRHGQHGP